MESIELTPLTIAWATTVQQPRHGGAAWRTRKQRSRRPRENGIVVHMSTFTGTKNEHVQSNTRGHLAAARRASGGLWRGLGPFTQLTTKSLRFSLVFICCEAPQLRPDKEHDVSLCAAAQHHVSREWGRLHEQPVAAVHHRVTTTRHAPILPSTHFLVTDEQSM